MWSLHLPCAGPRNGEAVALSTAPFAFVDAFLFAKFVKPSIDSSCTIFQLAVQYGHNVRFLKVDTDEEYELAHRMQVVVTQVQILVFLSAFK